MLRHNEVNPLSVVGLRRVDHCPPHFSPVFFTLSVLEKNITDWIYENLEGRFYLNDYYDSKVSGGFEMQKRVAFELPGEASYFALVLDTINKSEITY